MKKYILLILSALFVISFTKAQNKIVVHKNGQSSYESLISNIDSIKFKSSTSIFNLKTNQTKSISFADIDSITFDQEAASDKNVISITYNGSQVTILNPMASKGVSASANGAHVTITAASGIQDVEYLLSGNTDNGSLTIQSDKSALFSLNGVKITNPSGSAINITSDIVATFKSVESTANTLSDGNSSTQNATLLTKGALIFNGGGSITINGYKKHAISSNKTISVENGSIIIPQSASDGFHSESFLMNNGSLNIFAAGDAVDAGAGTIEINGGNIKVVSTASDVKGIKCDGLMTINGGTFNLNISGAQSKGFSTKGNLTFNGGNITIVASGSTVLSALNKGYDPSYCTAIKCDQKLTVNNGTFNIECGSTNDGARGFSADGDIIINNGTIVVSASGKGAVYTNESGIKDSYTTCCIKSNTNISILKGNITCTSTGAGGKGISADGMLVIGTSGADDALLVLKVTTTGERFLVSGTGENADYANPKAIKSEGNLTLNSGTLTITCTQKEEGGEGLESKNILTINGGVTTINTYDDCINAANHISITGGNHHWTATGNDCVDSNGTLSISGGFIIAKGTKAPESAFDCDTRTFAITGGVIIGAGGQNDRMPTVPSSTASTQRTIMYTGTAGNVVCIKDSSDKIILLYQMPAYSSSSSGGGPGGGSSSSMLLLFSDPKITTGKYTLQYGGTMSGGTTVNGYNTGGTYTGGSSKSFTVSSMVTTVN